MLTMQDILQGGNFQDKCIITSIKYSHKTTNDIPVYKVFFLVNIDNKLYTFNATTQEYKCCKKQIYQKDIIYIADLKFSYYPKTFRCKIYSIENLEEYNKGVL